MVEIYLVRHAETEGNLQQVFQGHLEYAISENGHRQLELLAKHLEGISFDRVYASPLSRAKLTASAIVGNGTVEIHEAPLLIELFGGDLQGRKFSDIFAEDEALKEIWHNHIQDFRATNGESMHQLYGRAWQGLWDICTDPENQGKTVLVVSHGGTIRCILCRLLFGSINHLQETDGSYNTAVSHLFYENGQISLDYANNISHLPGNHVQGTF